MGPVNAAPGTPAPRRDLLPFLAVPLFLAVAGTYASYAAYSGFSSYDDEGYLMISLQGYREGAPLYDSVFSRYGPFYYQWHDLIRWPAAVAVTHDTTRLITLAHWLAAAILLGTATGILTRSALAGAFAFMQSTLHLRSLVNEPGHPQELVVLLLAASALAAAAGSRGRMSLLLLGALVATLALTKINVGAFQGSALLIAVVLAGAGSRLGVWARVGGMLLGAGLPVLLMRHHLSQGWALQLCLLCGCSAAAGVAPWMRMPRGDGSVRRDLLRAGLGFFLIAGPVLAMALIRGSSPGGILEAILVAPARIPAIFWYEHEMSRGAVFLSVASLALAVAVFRLPEERCTPSLVAAAKGVYGTLGALVLAGRPGEQLDFLLPWAWILLLPAGKGLGPDPFPRGFLVLATTWQAFQVYPVAGTQVAVATFLLAAVFTACLADAVRHFVPAPGPGGRLRGLLVPSPWAVLLVLFSVFWCNPVAQKAAYERLEPCGLRGAGKVRMEASQAAAFRAVAAHLEAESDVFFTYPGLNSLYFWTDRRPLTGQNTTTWMTLLDDARQREILDRLKAARRPRIVVDGASLALWSRTPESGSGPLVGHIRTDYREVARFGNLQILAPHDPARPK